MKINTVAVTYGRKLNLGDYNSAHVEITLWADLDPEDDVGACEKLLWEEAKIQVKKQLIPLATEKEAQVESIFAGLPADFQRIVANGGE